MIRYRCCEHCKEDPVHALDVDDHEVPCNAPRSRGCIGREPSGTEQHTTQEADK